MGITTKMRDGTYNVTDRMVGVEGETTERLYHWRKGGYTGKELPNDRNEACTLPRGLLLR